ncbi:MAG: 2-phosphosulfolactate phosphatase [Firmicutes bacterium]|nr:2-phosphosulfolactate phosphatase [Bacillota bacterium]
MHIDCYFAHQHCKEAYLEGKDALVIDVLRATSSMITALDAGAQAIFPVTEVADAREYARIWPKTVLAGEREGERLSGFHLGNSPYEFTPQSVGGRIIISCSTNGTAAIVKASAAKRIWLAALINASAAAQRLLNENVQDLVIICSGTMGVPSLDDILTAGAVLYHLDNSTKLNMSDSARIAFGAYKYCLPFGMSQALKLSSHAQKLIRFDHIKDVEYCSRENISSTVPWLNKQDGYIYG